MGRLMRACVPLALLLAAAGAPTAADAAADEPAAKFKVGDVAPDFTLQDTGGRQVRLSSLRGSKVVLLNFWSLRCGACIDEVPYLNQIEKEFGHRDVAVVSVVTDGVDAAATTTIMKEVGVAPDYVVLVDPDFAVSDTYTSFVVPHTLVIDRRGVVRYVHTGFERGTEKRYRQALDEALDS